jgi:hypothetical protein
VTDGTIGVLSASNIVDWNLNLAADSSTFDLTGPLSGGNSYFYVDGNDFTATATGLFFNFSDASTGQVYTATFSGSAALAPKSLRCNRSSILGTTNRHNHSPVCGDTVSSKK